MSTETFQSLDGYLWTLTYKWALYRHNRRSKRQIVKRYFGQFHPSRKDRWVFGDRDTGAYLTRFAWTGIVRHDLVKGRSSPDDPALAGYWARRRRKNPQTPPISAARVHLLQKQRGRCPLCGDLLLHADSPPRHPEEWEQWAAIIRKAITMSAITISGEGGPDRDGKHLVHEHCRKRRLRAARSTGTLHVIREPLGLA